jgi:transcription initiation factor IIE alpha subunit
MNCLVAHCPTSGCYMRVPVCTLVSDVKPEFDPAVSMAVVCPSCEKEFRELASLLELSLLSEVTGKFQSRRRRVNTLNL